MSTANYTLALVTGTNASENLEGALFCRGVPEGYEVIAKNRFWDRLVRLKIEFTKGFLHLDPPVDSDEGWVQCATSAYQSHLHQVPENVRALYFFVAVRKQLAWNQYELRLKILRCLDVKPQFVISGDSNLTKEYGDFINAALEEVFGDAITVCNYSETGQNTKMALKQFQEANAIICANAIGILFNQAANDSVLSNSRNKKKDPRSVELLPDFLKDHSRLIESMRAWLPGAELMYLEPLPLLEKEEFKEDGDGELYCLRNSDRTREFALAASSTSESLSVRVVRLFDQYNIQWRDKHIQEGIHFNELGQLPAAMHIIKTIRAKCPVMATLLQPSLPQCILRHRGYQLEWIRELDGLKMNSS